MNDDEVSGNDPVYMDAAGGFVKGSTPADIFTTDGKYFSDSEPNSQPGSLMSSWLNETTAIAVYGNTSLVTYKAWPTSQQGDITGSPNSSTAPTATITSFPPETNTTIGSAVASSDGSKVAFIAQSDYAASLYTTPSAGGSPHKVADIGPENCTVLGWS